MIKLSDILPLLKVDKNFSLIRLIKNKFKFTKVKSEKDKEEKNGINKNSRTNCKNRQI